MHRIMLEIAADLTEDRKSSLRLTWVEAEAMLRIDQVSMKKISSVTSTKTMLSFKKRTTEDQN